MKKILVIEDNFEVRDNLCEILELANYEVVAAENGKIGIEKAKDEIPDLILCDVMMPELDGFGVMKILNKNPKINHIPLIFLTARSEKSDFRKGMGLGAEDYITKPFDDVELLDAIEIRLKKAEKIKATLGQSEQGLQRFFSEAKAHQEFDKLSEDTESRKYAIKDFVYEEGQMARWLFCVVKGQVKIIQTNDYGKELTIQIIGEGAFFGHFPLINDAPYSNSAVCSMETELRLIPKQDFSMLLFNNRDFAAHFIKLIANNADQTEQQLIEMAYASVRKKVANALLVLAGKSTSLENGCEINSSREDLASIAGTAKETLIRTMSEFKSDGIISIKGKSIKLNDVEKLQNIMS